MRSSVKNQPFDKSPDENPGFLIGLAVDEPLDPLVRRSFYLLRGAAEDDPALMQHGDPVGDLGGADHVVGDRYRGQRHLVPKVDDQIVDLVGHDGIQPGGGLVVEDVFRVHGDGPGQPHPLLHPAGELGRHQAAGAGHAHQLQLFIDDAGYLLGRIFRMLLEPQPHVLGHRQRIEQGRPLKQHTQALPQGEQFIFSDMGQLGAVNFDGSLIRLHQPDDMAQQDALAAARPADDHHGLPGVDRQVHPGQHLLGVEGFVYVGYLDH